MRQADPARPDGSVRWRSDAAVSGGATVALGLLTLASDQPWLEGWAAVLSNGLLLFFLLIGVQMVSIRRHRIGPFGSVFDTLADVGFRSAVVFLVVALAGRWAARQDEH